MYVSFTLYCFATRAHLFNLCIHFILLPTTGISLYSFWQALVTYTKAEFQRFRKIHCVLQINTVSTPIPSLNLLYIYL